MCNIKEERRYNIERQPAGSSKSAVRITDITGVQGRHMKVLDKKPEDDGEKAQHLVSVGCNKNNNMIEITHYLQVPLGHASSVQ
jgi:hypothetical protein